MAKTRTPVLSLGAHGTIGEALTYQKRHDSTVIRAKPVPHQPNTLPQMYQRWLYEDYAYRWTQQSLATQRIFAASGVTFHLTGFQYWMKYQLTTLPDIAGLWHLDTVSGGVTRDYSRNANHGTVIGPAEAGGVIDGALIFDGINDRVHCGISDTLNFRDDDFTIEAFVIPTVLDTTRRTIICKGVAGTLYILWLDNTDTFHFYVRDGANGISVVSALPLAAGNRYHVAGRRTGTTAYLFINGSLDVQNVNVLLDDINTAGVPFYIGTNNLTEWAKCRVDHAIAYNRALDDTEILRHAGRGYPL